jgi:hypothetical protein
MQNYLGKTIFINEDPCPQGPLHEQGPYVNQASNLDLIDHLSFQFDYILLLFSMLEVNA